MRTTGDAVAAAGADDTLLVTGTALLSLDQIEAVAATPSDLVLLDPDDATLGELTDAAVSAPGDAAATERAASCTDPDARAAGTLRTAGGGYRALTDDAVVCFPAPDGEPGTGALLVVDDGERRVTALVDSGVLTNERLAEDGNAALALRLLGDSDRLVWYVPAIDDLGDLGGPTAPGFGELLPPWAGPLALQLGLVVLVAAVWRGRRLGPLVTEPLPVIVRAAETTRGRGRLYRRSRAYGHAAAALRAGTARRAAARLGLPRSAAAPAVIDALSRATGRPADDVAALLYGPPPTDDADAHRAGPPARRPGERGSPPVTETHPTGSHAAPTTTDGHADGSASAPTSPAPGPAAAPAPAPAPHPHPHPHPHRPSPRRRPSCATRSAGCARRSPRPSSGRTPRSPGWSSRCCAAGTCCSRACPASPRRCSCGRCPRRSTWAPSASSSRPTSCPGTSPGRSSTTRAPPSSRSARARCSRTCCSPTRSTGRPRRPRRRSSRRWRSVRSASTASRGSLPDPFLVIATQNPVEYEGTYPLPEAQLDRFLLKLVLPLPERDQEIEVLARHAAGFDPRDLWGAGVRPAADARRARRGTGRGRARAGRPRGARLRRGRVPGDPPVAVVVPRRVAPRGDGAAVRRHARGPGCPVAATSRRTTSRRSRTPRCVTGSSCGPRRSSRGSRPRASWTPSWPPCRSPADGRRPTSEDADMVLTWRAVVLAAAGAVPVLLVPVPGTVRALGAAGRRRVRGRRRPGGVARARSQSPGRCRRRSG